MQQGNFIDVFLARHVSVTYAHHQERQTLSCSIWFSAPSLWMGGGLENRCVGRVCGADIARQLLLFVFLFVHFRNSFVGNTNKCTGITVYTYIIH